MKFFETGFKHAIFIMIGKNTNYPDLKGIWNENLFPDIV